MNGRTTNLTPQGGSTTPLDVTCGPIQSVLGHPIDPDICFVGARTGGIWRTDNCRDAMPEWIPLTDAAPSLTVGDMSFDSDDTLVVAIGPTELFSLEGGPRVGLLKTDDALGATPPEWVLLSNANGAVDFAQEQFQFSTVYTRGSVIIAGGAPQRGICTGGLFRSSDGGVSWSNVLGGLTGLHVVPDPTTPSRLYAAVAGGIFCGVGGPVFVSNDGGANWMATGQQPLMANVLIGLEVKLSVSQNGRLWCFATVTANQVTSQAVVAYSDDNGSNWISMDALPNPKPSNFGLVSLLGALSENNEVYIGGTGQSGPFPNTFGAVDMTGYIFRGDATASSSNQWSHITDSNTLSSSAPHSGSRQLAFRADGSLLEGNNGGIVVRPTPSDNSGDWFSLCGIGLHVFEVLSVAYEPRRQTVLFGTQGTASILGTLGVADSYTTLGDENGNNLAEPMANFVMVDFTSDPDHNYYYYGTRQLNSFFRLTLNIADDTIVAIDRLVLPTNTGARATTGAGALNPANPQQFAVEAGAPQGAANPNVGKSFVAYTTDRGDTFSTAETGFFDSNLVSRAFQMAWAHDGSVLYLSDGSGVSACSTGGISTLSCTLQGTIETLVPRERDVRELAVDPLDPQTVVAVSVNVISSGGVRVWKSTDGGVEWADITGTPIAEAELGEALTFLVAAGNSLLVVGTNRGVYVRKASGGWSLLALGLPNVRITQMVYDAIDDILAVATIGRGVWFLERASKALGSPSLGAFQEAQPAPPKSGMRRLQLK